MLYLVTICYLTLQYIAGYKAGCPIRVWLICSQIIHLSRLSKNLNLFMKTKYPDAELMSLFCRVCLKAWCCL